MYGFKPFDIHIVRKVKKGVKKGRFFYRSGSVASIRKFR